MEDQICRMNIRFTSHCLIKKSINCANTIAAVITERAILPRFPARGNGNKEFYKEITLSNLK
jgi:hypothetical protein